jgi:hypothetical protein
MARSSTAPCTRSDAPKRDSIPPDVSVIFLCGNWGLFMFGSIFNLYGNPSCTREKINRNEEALTAAPVPVLIYF